MEEIMKRKAFIMAACIVASTAVMAGSAYTSSATVTVSTASTAGISSVLQGYIATEQQAALVAYAAAVEAEAEAAAEVEANEVETVASEFENLAVAQVDGYVNIRSEASTDGEILGKLYDGSVATVLGTEGDWTYVQSGSVTGYIKTEYLAINNEEVFKANATRIATVTTETLYVRAEATTDSSVINFVGEGDELKVVEELDGWIKISIDGDEGYISADYATCSYTYEVAESKEEEEARLAAEEAAKQAAAARSSSSSTSSSSSYSGNSYTYDGSTGNAVCDYALQFLGNPYVYGGSSLTNGTDCSGFVMSVYANFGVSLPHSSYSMRSCGTGVDVSSMQAGDIVCYSGHVAIYIGNGQIVHASTYGVGITISSVYYSNIICVRRVL